MFDASSPQSAARSFYTKAGYEHEILPFPLERIATLFGTSIEGESGAQPSHCIMAHVLDSRSDQQISAQKREDCIRANDWAPSQAHVHSFWRKGHVPVYG